MNQPIETIAYKSYNIKIYQDQDPLNPRKEFDNLGTMVCFHKRYGIGDKHNFNNPSDFLSFAKKNNVIYLPLFLYDHSGITMNTTGFNCPWDSGQIGWIYIDRPKARKEYNKKVITKEFEKKILEYLKEEVELYNDYLTGNVYGYVVEAHDGTHIDSCWGFYGDDKLMIEQAKMSIEFELKTQQEYCEML